MRFITRNVCAILLSLLLSVFIFCNLYFGRHLWFWWDELTILESQISPGFGLFQNHVGNFFPLGRLAFLLEVLIFKDKYVFFIFINIIFIIRIVSQLISILRINFTNTNWDSIFALALFTNYLLNSGVLFNIQWGFQISWLLSISFALAAADAYLKCPENSSRPLIYLTLSWLSLGSAIVIATLLALALIANTIKLENILIIRSVLASILMLLIGLLVIRNFPSIDSSAMPPPFKFNPSPHEIFEIIKNAAIAFTFWFISPLSLRQDYLMGNLGKFGNTITSNTILGNVMAIMVLVIVAMYFRSKTEITNKIVVTGALIFAFLVSFRGHGSVNSDYEIRYAIYQSLFANIFWFEFLRNKFKSVNKGLTCKVLASMFVVTAITSIIFSVNTISEASDETRRTYNFHELDLNKKCDLGVLFELPESVQPRYNSTTFCEIYDKFH